VCDNVVNYELVLANGTIINVNENSYPDLRVALRGGSNNFGVLTRYDLKTFDQPPYWGGTLFHDSSTVQQQLAGFAEINSATDYDEYSHVIMSFFFFGGVTGVVNHIEYSKPGVVNPPSLQPITNITHTLSTMRISDTSDFAQELNEFTPNGQR
jgi:FAD/FMN-containing dehydrogenase